MGDALIAPLARIVVLAPFLCAIDGAAVRTITAAEIVVESVKPAGNSATPTRYGVTRDDLRRISTALPDARRIVPVREMPERAVRGERDASVQLIGTTDQYEHLDDLRARQGRFLMPKDVDNRNNVAVVDTLVARRLFPGGDAIGENIRVANHYFLIVGVVEPPSESDDLLAEGRVFVPLTAMRSRYGDTVIRRKTGAFEVERYELSRIHVVVADGNEAHQVIAVVEALLKRHHDRDDYSVRAVGSTAQERVDGQ